MAERIVRAPMASTVVEVLVARGNAITAGQPLVVIEAMKMEHELCASVDGTVVELLVQRGDAVDEGDVLLRLQPVSASPAGADRSEAASAGSPDIQPDSTALRADLRDLQQRLAFTTDAARPEAVARRRARASAPRARTSPTSATPAPSSSTARSPSPPSAAGAASTT